MKKARGFTLIEIVIVVAIIGLLMVVLVPSITSAWKTNNMKAARLQAERIVKSIKVGILSGDIETSNTAKAYSTADGVKVDINPTLNCVNYIKGIDTLFDEPDTNEDLVDPTADNELAQDNIFKIAYDSTNEKIVVFRAEANTSKSISENAEWQLYYEQ